MSQSYKVWCPEDGHDEDDAETIEAGTVHAAAEEYVAKRADDEDTYEVVVRHGDDTYDVTVDVEVTWSYNAMVTKRRRVAKAQP